MLSDDAAGIDRRIKRTKIVNVTNRKKLYYTDMSKKVLITQPRPLGEHNPYDLLEHHHEVSVDFQPFVRIEGLTAKEFREQKINPLDYTAVILNSKVSADHFFRLCKEMRISVPETMHYYCQNESVGNYLQKFIEYRKRRVFFSETNHYEDLLPTMYRRKEEGYLMVLGEHYTEDMYSVFTEHDIEVTPAVMYRTAPYIWPEDRPFDYDVIAFFTASGAHAFCENFPDFRQGETALIAYGANTAQALTDAGLRVDKTAPTPQCPSILSAIDQYLSEQG